MVEHLDQNEVQAVANRRQAVPKASPGLKTSPTPAEPDKEEALRGLNGFGFERACLCVSLYVGIDPTDFEV